MGILDVFKSTNLLPTLAHRPFLEVNNIPLCLSSEKSSKRFSTLSSVTDESAQYLTAYAKSSSDALRMTAIRV